MAPPRRDPLIRFLEKVDMSGECWIWTAMQSKGYGKFGMGGKEGRLEGAHRASWILHVGPIREGLWVLHRCDAPLCVNPNHLFLGSAQDNTRDMMNKGRNLPTFGETNGMSKLTAPVIAEIKQLAGLKSQREIGEIFGIHQSQVSRILSKKRWPHLED